MKLRTRANSLHTLRGAGFTTDTSGVGQDLHNNLVERLLTLFSTMHIASASLQSRVRRQFTCPTGQMPPEVSVSRKRLSFSPEVAEASPCALVLKTYASLEPKSPGLSSSFSVDTLSRAGERTVDYKSSLQDHNPGLAMMCTAPG